MAVRHIFLALVAAASAAPALAQSAPAVATPIAKVGQVLRDANAARIGEIERVSKDGSVQVVYQQRSLVIPASTLSIADGKLMTSMTRKDLGKR